MKAMKWNLQNHVEMQKLGTQQQQGLASGSLSCLLYPGASSCCLFMFMCPVTMRKQPQQLACALQKCQF